MKYENLASDLKFFPGCLPSNATAERLLNHWGELFFLRSQILYIHFYKQFKSTEKQETSTTRGK